MDDLFTPADQPQSEETLREEITKKWKEKFPQAPEELIEAKVNSDLFIKTIERQKDELRSDYIRAQEELQTRQNLQDLIDRLNEKTTQQAQTPIKPEEKPIVPDLKDIEKLFESKFEQRRLADKEASNFNEVQVKLRERFGNNANNVLQEQASTLGLSKEDVNSLAKKSPEAFFRIMGLNQAQGQDSLAPPRTSIRNDNFGPKIVKRTWSYYQDMKAKNPKQYWDPKTQVQMHKDAEALGAGFEDGDFSL